MTATIATVRPGGVRTFWETGAATAGSDDMVDTSGENVSGGEISKNDYFTFYSLTGTYRVYVSMDGTNWSDMMALVNLCDTANLNVTTSVANQVFGIQGVFKHIKVTSVTACTAFTMAASKLS